MFLASVMGLMIEGWNDPMFVVDCLFGAAGARGGKGKLLNQTSSLPHQRCGTFTSLECVEWVRVPGRCMCTAYCGTIVRFLLSYGSGKN